VGGSADEKLKECEHIWPGGKHHDNTDNQAHGQRRTQDFLPTKPEEKNNDIKKDVVGSGKLRDQYTESIRRPCAQLASLNCKQRVSHSSVLTKWSLKVNCSPKQRVETTPK